MSCVIKSVSTYEETSAFLSYVVARLYLWLRPPMQCIALTVERGTEQTPIPSAHAQQAVAVLPGALLDHSADGCLAVILFRMRNDMLMRQIK